MDPVVVGGGLVLLGALRSASRLEQLLLMAWESRLLLFTVQFASLTLKHFKNAFALSQCNNFEWPYSCEGLGLCYSDSDLAGQQVNQLGSLMTVVLLMTLHH